MLGYIKPDIVHVLFDGRIVKTGGPELAAELEKQGYEWITGEFAPAAASAEGNVS
jgi:Fe-S cluster assembly ATP-binding protein